MSWQLGLAGVLGRLGLRVWPRGLHVRCRIRPRAVLATSLPSPPTPPRRRRPPPRPSRLPAKAKATYLYLHSERRYSDLTLFAGLLAVPVVVGLSLICALDAYYSRRPAHPQPPHAHHPHFD